VAEAAAAAVGDAARALAALELLGVVAGRGVGVAADPVGVT
jgi:hypothetical protein